jgi:hypothetical protein
MSDHDPATDPVDTAYARAEAVLESEAARAARRAWVLEAATLEPTSTAAVAAAAARARRPPPWRRGGWLAAASVAGIAVLLAARLYQPEHEPPPPAAAAPSASPRAAVARAQVTSPPAAAAPTPQPEHPHRTFVPAPPQPAAAARTEVRAAAAAAAAPENLASPPAQAAPAPPPPPATAAAAAVAVLAAPQSSAQKSIEVVVTGSRIARRDRQVSAERLTTLPLARTEYDPAARLRAAAASGRTSEIQTLLAQGVPVDAPDADGDTALMRSIQVDRPAAAALLLRHGANLDQKNLSGVSARDMATARDDPELDRALGLGP